MSSIFTHILKLKWFGFMLIIFFVGNGVLGQVSGNEKSDSKKNLLKYLARQENNRQIMICFPELAKEMDSDVPLESWMLEENFGLDVLMGESEPPLRQWMISNETWIIDNSMKSLKGHSEFKTWNYIKHK